jgi:hypothetical protein
MREAAHIAQASVKIGFDTSVSTCGELGGTEA